MDSYAIARAESRIRDLESEIERLKSDAQDLRHDMQRMERKESARMSFVEDVFLPFMWMGACGLVGVSIALIIGELLGKL
jgi:hypothetical protein